jgi:hypothetical protein
MSGNASSSDILLEMETFVHELNVSSLEDLRTLKEQLHGMSIRTGIIAPNRRRTGSGSYTSARSLLGVSDVEELANVMPTRRRTGSGSYTSARSLLGVSEVEELPNVVPNRRRTGSGSYTSAASLVGGVQPRQRTVNGPAATNQIGRPSLSKSRMKRNTSEPMKPRNALHFNLEETIPDDDFIADVVSAFYSEESSKARKPSSKSREERHSVLHQEERKTSKSKGSAQTVPPKPAMDPLSSPSRYVAPDRKKLEVQLHCITPYEKYTKTTFTPTGGSFSDESIDTPVKELTFEENEDGYAFAPTVIPEATQKVLRSTREPTSQNIATQDVCTVVMRKSTNQFAGEKYPHGRDEEPSPVGVGVEGERAWNDTILIREWGSTNNGGPTLPAESNKYIHSPKTNIVGKKLKKGKKKLFGFRRNKTTDTSAVNLNPGKKGAWDMNAIDCH